jgi:hypothetical protein
VTALDADGAERHKWLTEDGYYYSTGAIRSQIFLKGNYAAGATDVGVLHFMNAANTYVGRMDCSSTTAGSDSKGVFRWHTSDGAGTNVLRATLDETGLRLDYGSADLPSFSFFSDIDTGIWRPAANTWAVSTAGLERLRVDNGGRILVGTTVSRSGGPATHPIFQLEGLAAGSSAFQCVAGSTTATVSPQIVLGRHRGTVVGQSTAVVDADSLGVIRFVGADGTELSNSSTFIESAVDGAPTTNSVPGRIVFATTTVGGTQSLERMRITSSGNVGIGTTTPASRLDVSGVITVSAGTAASPAIVSTTGTSDTGLFFPGADTWAVSTAGTERLRVTSAGNVGIGTTSPANALDVAGSVSVTGTITGQLRTTPETLTSPAITAGVLTLNLANGTIFSVSMSANITSIVLQNIPAGTNVVSFTLILTATGTARTVAWPSGFRWPDGLTPVLTSTNGKIDVLSFMSFNNGTTWLGLVGGQNF